MIHKKLKLHGRKLEGIPGSLIGGGMMGAFLVLLSPIFINYEYLDQSQLWLIATSIHMMTACVITFICIKQGNGNGILTGAIGVGIWLLTVTVIGAAIFEGRANYILTTIIGNAVGYALAVFVRYLLMNQNKKRWHSQKRR